MVIKKSIISIFLLSFMGVAMLHDFLPHVHVNNADPHKISHMHDHHGQGHHHEHNTPADENEKNNFPALLVIILNAHIESSHNLLTPLMQSDIKVQKKNYVKFTFNYYPIAEIDKTLYRKKDIPEKKLSELYSISSHSLRAPPVA